MGFVDNDSFITSVPTTFCGSPELRLYKYGVHAIA
jgi:hypothetical protein